MSLDHLQSHYGFTRMPFGRALAPQMLHRHASHAEAAARISWCISERALGVVTGEVGAGKTVAMTRSSGRRTATKTSPSKQLSRRRRPPLPGRRIR